MYNKALRSILSTVLAFAVIAPVHAHAQTRVVTTTFGDVVIPLHPAKIVTNHAVAMLPLVELGIVPVGRPSYDENYASPEIWELIKAVPVVVDGERNLEAIAALEPDLIFEVNVQDDDVFQRLRQIAPTVTVGVTGADRADWQNRARQIADVVGALDRWQELENELASRQATIAARYGDFLAENPIAIWTSWDSASPAVYASQSVAGAVLLPTGAVFADGVEALPYEGYEAEISLEQIGAVLGDARIVFYSTDHRGTPAPEVEEIRGNYVYQRVTAVAEGREFSIGTAGIAGYTNAFYLLDSFEAALAQLVTQP